jgi:hypothetical protein
MVTPEGKAYKEAWKEHLYIDLTEGYLSHRLLESHTFLCLNVHGKLGGWRFLEPDQGSLLTPRAGLS